MDAPDHSAATVRLDQWRMSQVRLPISLYGSQRLLTDDVIVDVTRLTQDVPCWRPSWRTGTHKNKLRITPDDNELLDTKVNMHIRPPNGRTEMYAGRVACCPLVSHVEFASRALLTLEKRRRAPLIKVGNRWDRRTDRRKTDVLRLTLDATSVIKRIR